MLERQIQQKVLHYCKSKGAEVFKVGAESQRGLPDLLVVMPTGCVLLLEIKTEKGRLSKLQERMIRILRGNKANVFVVRSVDEVKTILEDLGF